MHPPHKKDPKTLSSEQSNSPSTKPRQVQVPRENSPVSMQGNSAKSPATREPVLVPGPALLVPSNKQKMDCSFGTSSWAAKNCQRKKHLWPQRNKANGLFWSKINVTMVQEHRLRLPQISYSNEVEIPWHFSRTRTKITNLGTFQIHLWKQLIGDYSKLGNLCYKTSDPIWWYSSFWRFVEATTPLKVSPASHRVLD